MKNNRINFNFSFLDSESVNQEILPKSDWDGILSCLEHAATRALLKQLAYPLGVSKSEVLIGFKSQKIADMINNSNKIQYIIDACNKFYNQSSSNVIVICTSEEIKEEQEDTNIYGQTKTQINTANVNKSEKNDNSNEENEISFTKIKYGNESDMNWKPIIMAIVVILICGLIGYGISQDKKRTTEIKQIKDTAYSYIKSRNKDGFEEELDKLKQYGIDETSAINEFKQRYNEERRRVISDIAYNYENNREVFNSLKQEYLPVFFNNNVNAFNEAIEQKLGYKELSLKPTALPNSGIMHNYTGKEAIAPFEIKTQGGDNYYIKLVDVFSGETKIVIFLRGGETKEMAVPLGVYKIKYATGQTWYGEDNLFGHNTDYSSSDTSLTFSTSGSRILGHTLELYKSYNGNFSTKDIKAEDF